MKLGRKITCRMRGARSRVHHNALAFAAQRASGGWRCSAIDRRAEHACVLPLLRDIMLREVHASGCAALCAVRVRACERTPSVIPSRMRALCAA